MKTNTIIKRVIDAALTVTLLLLMAFQVTEQLAHEWLGIAMFALTIVHQVLNRKFYAALFKGKYSPLRIFQLIVNILLLLSFVCTALSGMMMSRFATPFMNGLLPSSVVRQGHLALSHWSFVLMGLHLGLHFGIITSKLKNRTVRILLGIVMTGISVYGFYLFFKSDMLNYMLLKNPFAFLDYEKAWWLVLLENLAMLLAWGFAAYLLSLFLRSITKKDKRKPALLFALLLIVVIVSSIVLNTVLNSQQTSATPSWSTPQNNPTQATVSKDNKGISDNYVLIKGGSFLMGSPESENWRGDDETQHKVRSKEQKRWMKRIRQVFRYKNSKSMLSGAEDSALATGCENREMPIFAAGFLLKKSAVKAKAIASVSQCFYFVTFCLPVS